MKLYIAECYDRHIDPVIRGFDTSEAALKNYDWLKSPSMGYGTTDNPVHASVGEIK